MNNSESHKDSADEGSLQSALPVNPTPLQGIVPSAHDPPKQATKLPSNPLQAAFTGWWNSLSPPMRVAMVGFVGVIVTGICGIIANGIPVILSAALGRLQQTPAQILTSIPTAAAIAAVSTSPSASPTPSITPATTALTFTSTPSVSPSFTAIPIGTVISGTSQQGIAQVRIAAGCFWMGSDPAIDPNAQPDEQPSHQVCITHDYWIDKTEVTNQSYQDFINAGGYSNNSYWSAAGLTWRSQNPTIRGPLDFPNFTSPNQPRVGVSWYEAEAYAHWRGGRLPTEAEWEYAARGPNSPIYPWGNVYNIHDANVNESNVGGIDWKEMRSVGSYQDKASYFGALDMIGNAAEWVQDFYAKNYYSSSPTTDPIGPPSGNAHVLRGGSWHDTPQSARAAFRHYLAPVDRKDAIGFRIVVLP